MFREIIDYCYQHELPLPDVGYELMNDAGEVVEELELAWPDLNVGVYASDDFDALAYEEQGWKIFSADVVLQPHILEEALADIQ